MMRLLFLLLILKIFTGSSSGSIVTSCDSCHDEATCIELNERGDTFSDYSVSCVCKEGFVGDGLKCYDVKLCSDLSCCKEGYQWSAERGCVDTDECSLPDSPCKQHQVCQNTPGSYECLEPSPHTRSGPPSSRSVMFRCGQTFCPPGMDCLSFNGSLHCVDPCQLYTVLDDDWRSTNNTYNQNPACDRNVIWRGWYRLFLGVRSAIIPERCVASHMCGTHAPMWITAPHPAQSDLIVNRTVCANWVGDCCRFNSHSIHVKHCPGNYYVYKLIQPSFCSLAYCTEVDDTADYETTFMPFTTPDEAPQTPDVTTPAQNISVAVGEVRLIGGNNPCSGRVELFYRGQWGTVCDDSWGLVDAQVVCRQLGCGRVLSAPMNAAFGQGRGPIWMDDVTCSGSETNLTQCRHRGFGSHDCSHSEDASVVCEASSPVRLVNSNSRCSGRVEVYHNGRWGTVCDDGWDLRDANVVCRQMDCAPARSALSNAAFGQGSGPIWLDDVACSGNESSISECRHRGFGVHNCHHVEDASVICIEYNATDAPSLNTTTFPTPSTTMMTNTPAQNISIAEGEVRLIGGNNSCIGRVELFYRGQWGTVCDDSWGLVDAQVVCRQLGCGRVLSAPMNAAFGQGRGPIWMDDVACSGSETNLTQCRHRGFGSHDCSHSEDASVVCEASSAVRLVNSNSRCSGRVEVYHNGRWGTVCDDNWDLRDANVVCRQMDCGPARSALSNAAFGQGSGPIWLDDVACSGSESSIRQCGHRGFGVHNCHHVEDASVICIEYNATDAPSLNTTTFTTPSTTMMTNTPAQNISIAEGEVRLIGGNNSCIGRVELFYRGQWGTVCDDSWGLVDAQVVCRQLGCGRVLSAPMNAAFGQGRGPIWMDDVTCSGSETNLTQCRHRGFGSHNCGHNEDASVVCEASSPVRLVNSNSRCSGRVEVYHNGRWGTVCDDGWDLRDANVVCRQMDCAPARSALSNAAFGQGSGPIWLDDVACSGNESSISECRHRGFGVHNCHHVEDASVICIEYNATDAPSLNTTTFTTPSTTMMTNTPAQNISIAEGEVRLIGGNNSCIGRVELFYRGQWGTVCDDSWGLVDAQVVCRQLGCGRVLSAPMNAAFGQGRGPIWMDDVTCSGSETNLTQCRHRGFGSHNCGHNEDASVVCEASSPVRLVNSNSRCSGRVEVYHNGRWGTVCDDSWDLRDANVVCRQMDCGPARSALSNAAFGQGSGPIWLDDVACSGSESSISECRHRGFGVHNCHHVEDASVICEVTPNLHHQLICGPNKIQVGLNWVSLSSAGFNPVSGNFAALNCSSVRMLANMVWYEVDAVEGACGNTLTTNQTHAIYSNHLFIYRGNNGSTNDPVRIPVYCAYPLDTDSSLHVPIRPFLPQYPGITGSGAKARASMALYRTSAFTQTYPAGRVSLQVGSPLYVGVSVTGRDPRFVLVLENCYATSSSNPNDPVRHPLIRNKCPADRQQVSVIESGRSFRARFSALLFLFQEDYRDIFLHCSLSQCDRRNFCVPSCARRASRSVSSSDVMEPLTIGPISWLK